MTAREIYFCVGQPEGVHSGVWKAWVQGDELYATQVGGMAAVAKVSVHRSGVCRLATTSPAALEVDWDNDADPRVAHRWQIEEVGSSAWCQCLTFLVPAVVVPQRFSATRFLSQRQLSRVAWVQPALVGSAVVVTFVRAKDSRASLDDFMQGEYSVLGSLRLREGSKIWVVRQEQTISREDLISWQTMVQDTVMHTDDPGSAHFASFVSPADFSHPLLRDIALGRWNFQRNE